MTLNQVWMTISIKVLHSRLLKHVGPMPFYIASDQSCVSALIKWDGDFKGALLHSETLTHVLLIKFDHATGL